MRIPLSAIEPARPVRQAATQAAPLDAALLERHPLPPALFNTTWLLADMGRHAAVLLQTVSNDNLDVGQACELQRIYKPRCGIASFPLSI
jgi:hypothetical protein